MQGEVQRDTQYLSLFYSKMKAPMRHALRDADAHASGIIALELLRQYLWPRSYDDLWELLETYDDHVVEFSACASH
jgi:hypothetical protein